MTTDEKFNLITRNLEETLTEGELKELLISDKPLKHYIGFEISGKVHLGQGIAVLQKVKELADVGAETIIFLADWHTWINKKLDGTLETATRLAREYFEEAMKAGYLCVGILLYPAMQAADIFKMGINIAHAGTDQRNVHIVARDAAKDLGERKPVAIHHHLIMGLKPLGENDDPKLKELANKSSREGLSYEEKSSLITALKMSKSKPDTAIFITDSPEEIKRKVNNAYCPEGEVNLNPILDWCKYLVFYTEVGSSLKIVREDKHGGDVTYSSYEGLEKDFADKKLHPQDLKAAVAEWLVIKLEPARKYFEDPKRSSALEEIEKLMIK